MAWLTSEQALAALGTKAQSLYASVSRGRIRAKPDPSDPRKSLYDRDDVHRLATRAAGRRKTETVAAETIRWGDPVMSTSLTAIAYGRLYYRGRDVVALAGTATLEQVAALLWDAGEVSFSVPAAASTSTQAAPLQAAFAALADRAATDGPALGRSPASLHVEAAELVGTLAAALGAAPIEMPLHRRLASAWRRPETAHLLRRALVLLADHELSASTFAARITASTGSSLAAATLSGLATLIGPLHGGTYAAIATLVAHAEIAGASAAFRHLGDGEKPLPGFGHRLYPQGDPRAEALLSDFPLPPAYAAIAAMAHERTGEPPNVDFALSALAAAHGLPANAPLLLLALARSVGWLAHAQEQISTGSLIRPRANYVGFPSRSSNDERTLIDRQ